MLAAIILEVMDKSESHALKVSECGLDQTENREGIHGPTPFEISIVANQIQCDCYVKFISSEGPVHRNLDPTYP